MTTKTEMCLAAAFVTAGLAAVPALAQGTAKRIPATEERTFHVKWAVTYRCYGGYGPPASDPRQERAINPTKVKDPRTGFVCDNKTYQKTLLDKSVSVTIKVEPTPDESKELVGDWTEEAQFMGRKFSVALTLFKEGAGGPYRLRLTASDDEPDLRQRAIFTEFETPRAMNPLTFDSSSSGSEPLELQYSVTIAPERDGG